MAQPRGLRNFNDPTYKKWRLRVYKRDFFTCRMCGSNKNLQAHHIKRWAEHPSLHYVVHNGITLCELCHTIVKDKEELYEAQFTLMVGQKQAPANKSNKEKKKCLDNLLNIRMAMRKKDEKVQGN